MYNCRFPHRALQKAKDIESHFNKGRIYLRYICNKEEYDKIKNMNKKPIIIGGCGRSGTTILLSLISTHPSIFAIPDETFAFCRSFYFSGSKPFIRIHKVYKILSKNLDKVWCCLRWAEKSPKNIQSFELLEEFFGNEFRFLNIVRDGRDVVTSKHPENEDGGYWVSCERWVKDVKKGIEIEEKNNVLTIKYENLTESYKQVMNNVFEFLGMSVPCSELERFPESQTIGNISALKEGVTEIKNNSRQVGRWDNKRVDQLLSMPDAVKLMEHYGYL